MSSPVSLGHSTNSLGGSPLSAALTARPPPCPASQPHTGALHAAALGGGGTGASGGWHLHSGRLSRLEYLWLRGNAMTSSSGVTSPEVDEYRTYAQLKPLTAVCQRNSIPNRYQKYTKYDTVFSLVFHIFTYQKNTTKREKKIESFLRADFQSAGVRSPWTETRATLWLVFPKGFGGRNLRPHSTPATLMWLEENYEMAEGVCIPRNTLYLHYVDFCNKKMLQPVNAASFGKIIRQQFPGLTTRRLGTRGQSRYHYYGIAIREGSIYYEVNYSKKGIHSEGGQPIAGEVTEASLTAGKLSTVLPEFPSLKDVLLPPHVAPDKVATFVMMYRTHCQRILDTVIRASFDEIQSFLVHFWQGIPPHLVSILGTNVLVNLVGVCDSILYRAVCSVLMPSVLQAIPDSLTQVIRKFTHDLDSWLRVALDDLPENLRQVKIDLARRFARMLRRQTSLNHLCQASRMVLHSPDITQQMIHDWRQVDLEAISHQTFYAMDKHTTNGVTVELIMNLYSDFERLLEEGAPLEAYSEWLEAMVERCVLLGARRNKAPIHKVAHSFLLMWSCFGTRVIRDMTLHSAPSFGSFHLLHLMFDDYVLYLVESLHAEEKARELLNNIATDSPPDCSDPGFGEPDNEDSLHALSFLMGGSTGMGMAGLASPSTPGVSPNSQPSHDLHISPTPTNVLGLDGSLVDEDGSMDYIASGVANSVGAGVGVQAGNATPAITSVGVTATASSVSASAGVGGGGGGGGAPMSGDYYAYEYDSRSYRIPSSFMGRNYLYPPTSAALNQSVLYSANYYQAYDPSYYSNRFKAKDIEG
ncbi:transcription factor RFX4-like [Penaeus indicus]|uniref:transcription factor RFX4-like n=1 Tax=Penaeus indicus TaxID=29960 RepID=UPI00300D14B5